MFNRRTLRIAALLAPALACAEGRALAQSALDASLPSTASSSSSAASTGPLLPDSSLTGAAPFGSAVRLGALPSPFTTSGGLNGSLATPTGLQFTPSIGVSEQAIVGGFPKYLGLNNEFITSLTPGLRVAGSAPIGRIAFDYQPSFDYYAHENQDSGVSQALNGSFSTTLIPNRLTLNASAYLTQQATAGGFAPGGYQAIGPHQRTTTQSYLISPRYRRKFIDLGALDIIYSAQYTSQNGNRAALSGGQQPYFTPNDVFSQTGRARFTTVPLYANVDDRVSLTATQYIGSGILNNSSVLRGQDEIRYAIRPHDLIFVSGGYEDLRYQGLPPTHIADATWSVGVQLHPRPHVELVVSYRHRDGFNAPYLRATLQLTPRTTLSANYAETLATQAQSVAANLAGATVNFSGQAIGGVGQTPLLLTNNSLSVQSGLFRNHQFSIATTTIWSRDTLSLNLVRSNETLVANAPGTLGFSQHSLSASANFSHQLTPNASVSTYFDYSTIANPVLGVASSNNNNVPVYAGAITGRYRTAHQLEFSLQLAVTNTSFNGLTGSQSNSGNGVQTSITFGVQKVF
jgi:uncharacterized protein (PEP-CTERM system associated)